MCLCPQVEVHLLCVYVWGKGLPVYHLGSLGHLWLIIGCLLRTSETPGRIGEGIDFGSASTSAPRMMEMRFSKKEVGWWEYALVPDFWRVIGKMP